MTIYTIGFTQKSAEQFFERIRYYRIQILVDIRLYNKSQLTGFTNGRDLPYFLSKICNCEYRHCINYAPTKKILNGYRDNRITWAEYEMQYKFLMDEREAVKDFITNFDGLYESVCLLCSEPTPEHCHRRLFAEMVKEQLPGTEIIHL